MNSRREAAVHAGDGAQPAALRGSATCACARPMALCFDFEWTQSQPVLRLVSAFAIRLSNARIYKAEGLPSPASWLCSSRFAGPSADTAFGEAVTQPAPTAPAVTASCSAGLRKPAGRGRLEAHGSVFANDKGEPLTLEYLVDDDAFVRVSTPSSRTCGQSASTRACGRSIRRNTRCVRTSLTST